MNALAHMTPAQVDELLGRARRALKGHEADTRTAAEPGEFRVAISTILGTLQEVAALHPAKASEIANIVARYRPASLDG